MKKTGEMVVPRQRDDAVTAFVRAGSASIYANHFKRVLDVVFAIATIPFVLPVLAVLCLIVRRDGGPFLYSHTRIGRDGENFGCLKIRTMVVDAEKVLQDLLESDPEIRAEWQRHFKLRNDPRITPIGRILRKTSLDELPQIFNILRGDMSVVGPRPITAEELDHYGEAANSYAAVRPGLTGPWQVTGRRENDFESRARLDVEYASKVNWANDIYILFATVPEVLFARGR